MAQTIEVGNFYMALLGNYHVAATVSHLFVAIATNKRLSKDRLFSQFSNV